MFAKIKTLFYFCSANRGKACGKAYFQYRIEQLENQSAIAGAGIRVLYCPDFGYATTAARPAMALLFFIMTEQLLIIRFVRSTHVPIMCYTDQDGRWFVNPPTDSHGYKLPADMLNAIIDACKQDLLDFDDERRIAHNNSIDSLIYEKPEKSKFDFEQKCQVYLIEDTLRSVFKIGVANCAKRRFKSLKTANPGILMRMFYDGVYSDEPFLHNMFKSKHVDGEWFRLSNSDIRMFESYFNEKHLPF